MFATLSARHPTWARTGVVLVAVYVIFWVQFAVARQDNFGGVDEWLVLSLASHGTLPVPYANRPLGLLFNVPVALFPGHLLEASYLLHGHYLVLAGLLTSLVVLRIAPERHEWALLAGVVAAVWAPSDLLRLDSIYSSAYSGITAATMLVVLLLATAADRPVPVAAAAGLAFLTTRVHEGALPVLLVAPLLLMGLGVRIGRRTLAAYWAVLALALLVAALPLLLRDRPGSVYRLADGFPTLRGRPESWYQTEIMRPSLDPVGVVVRLGEQLRLHTLPLFQPTVSALLRPAALVSGALLVAAMAALGLGSGRAERRPYAAGVGVGIVGATASYSAFVLATHLRGASRMEFLAAPWIGLALATAICLMVTAAPERLRLPAAAGLGALVVVAAAGRTTQAQWTWDQISTYRAQRASLTQMTSVAASLRPGTLVILLDGAQAWLGTYAFHHALDLIYGPQVAGCVPNAQEQIFYFCDQGPDGVRLEPWDVVKGPWRARSRTFRFDEIVVFRSDASGHVSLSEEWPQELPAAGPGYAPRLRFDASAPHPATRAILGSAR